MFATLKSFFAPKRQLLKLNYVQIFKDEKLQVQFESNGFAVIDFLDEEQIVHLLNFYESEHSTRKSNGFVATTFDEDRNFVKKINDEILRIAGRSLEKHFSFYKPVFANFLVKSPYTQSQVAPHQDWNFVDEEKYFTINIWTALTDTNIDNGTLGLIPNSHRVVKNYRGTGNPFISTSFDEQKEELYPLTRFIPLKRGQAIAYDMRMLHASNENKTDKTRFACAIAIVPEAADYWHCHQQQNSKEIDVYEVDGDFMVKNEVAKLIASKTPIRKVRNELFNVKDIVHLLKS